MNIRPLPPLEYLLEAFEVSDKSPSGLLWRERPRYHFRTERGWRGANARHAGTRAGGIHIDNRGYCRWDVKLDGRSIVVARIIYAMMYENLTTDFQVDHIDGNSLNNIFSNLRLATHAQNIYNSKRKKANRAGFKGIKYNSGQWEAKLVFEGKSYYLGLHRTKEAAYSAYCEASVRLHGEFSRTA